MEEEKDISHDVTIIPEEHFGCEEDRGGPLFVPQLYLQRYFYVQQELEKRNVRSIADFGSAECKISKYLVRIPSIEKIALVDIDGGLLEGSTYNIQPLISDYVKCRNNSLTVKVYEGSVTQLDEAVYDYEAVSMVEIIEHLYPDVLKAACDMVFGSLKPRVAIVTTPNADYNQLFPNFTGFRHWDHKFEWTQKEFHTWAEAITQTFHYTVEYSGVGDPPMGSEHLGFCSQIAIFTRQASHNIDDVICPVTQTYKLIAECNYPYRQTVQLSETESLLQEVDYQIRQTSRSSPCSLWETECQDEEDVKCLIPISYFLKFEKFKTKFGGVDQFRTFLQNHGYRISPDGQSVIIPEDPLSDDSSDYSYDGDLCDNYAHDEETILCVTMDQTDLTGASKGEQNTLCDSGVALDRGDCGTGEDSECWE